jgi:hypothetical protein
LYFKTKCISYIGYKFWIPLVPECGQLWWTPSKIESCDENDVNYSVLGPSNPDKRKAFTCEAPTNVQSELGVVVKLFMLLNFT